LHLVNPLPVGSSLVVSIKSRNNSYLFAHLLLQAVFDTLPSTMWLSEGIPSESLVGTVN
jgi:hypothetical protein